MDTTCYTPLHMVLGPGAQAFSYLVPTKYFFLPYSRTQSSEIPFLMLSKEHFVYLTPIVSPLRPYPLHTSRLMSLPTLAGKNFLRLKNSYARLFQ